MLKILGFGKTPKASEEKSLAGLFFCPYFSLMITIEITGTPALDSIITLAELKEHLRVDSTDEDTLITAYRMRQYLSSRTIAIHN